MTSHHASEPVNPLLDRALYLATMGWAVFPLAPGTKRQPAVKNWEERATTDRTRVRRCWSVNRWNIGVATGPSGLVVVDLDLPKDGDTGPAGADALAALADERGGPLPPTYTVTTPSGGCHLYYLAPAGTRLRNTAKHICANVDTRAGGGYVVGPGSVTDLGAYELADDRDPVELPGWLVQACAERPAAATSRPVEIRSARTDSYGAAALRGEVERVRSAGPGTYNGVLSSAAYTIGRKVGADLIPHPVARAELIAAGETLIGSEHWPPHAREVARVVDAGLAAGAANPVARRRKAA
ncbi:DNA primase [Prauserella marina]|uniref:Bifunctional DNA primase/polymerase, N-terminal n=1 Tax=Prauserella marina TaxID=530584 RepID=A0A222VJC1_9PSEU|nr:bifunctional DNA primase/polymerase [Prauserella marina]ASR34030.1 DNA primase [Prauserella marina]PWV82657.1 bifunctional DNA primase/polymerase-like protein [Prauserella marina]SDC74003.1 Bifunctional DNA primase/polymerase, N-terminal [Prauserella marina]